MLVCSGGLLFFDGFQRNGLRVFRMLVYVFLFRFVPRYMKFGGGFVPSLCLFEILNLVFFLFFSGFKIWVLIRLCSSVCLFVGCIP